MRGVARLERYLRGVDARSGADMRRVGAGERSHDAARPGARWAIVYLYECILVHARVRKKE